AAVTEGNSGLVPMSFQVVLSAASSVPVSIDYIATDFGTPMVGVDFQATSGTLTFNPGETSKYITVNVIGDTLYEQDETFIVKLFNEVNGYTGGTHYSGLGTIVNDDAMPTLSVTDAAVVEGNYGPTNAVFTVSLSAPSGLPATVYYNPIAGTATSGTDYNYASGYLYIPAGQTSITVPVGVRGDTAIEP